MTDKEILEESIFQAEEKGYQGNSLDYAPLYEAVSENEAFEIKINYTIFSHEFAKAFWGEEEVIPAKSELDYGDTIVNEGWKYHLPIMVLEKEPLKYLEKFLDV